jgi:hypothetical protein
MNQVFGLIGKDWMGDGLYLEVIATAVIVPASVMEKSCFENALGMRWACVVLMLKRIAISLESAQFLVL